MRLVWLSWLPFVACNGPDPKDGGGTTDPPPAELCGDHPGEAVCDGETAVVCADDGKVASYEGCAPDTCADGACVGCSFSVEVPYADPGRLADGLAIEVDPDATPARMRPITLVGAATVSFTGALVLLDAEGETVSSGDRLGPQTLLVAATATGVGSVRFEPGESCDGEPVALATIGVAPAPIAVRALDGFPWAERYDVFTARDTVSAWIDAGRYPDRVGVEADLYVVPHRGADGWRTDPSLADAVAGPVPYTVPAGVEPIDVWSGLPSDVTLAGYDLVADFGHDGQLDPGDLLDGLLAPAFVIGGDLSAPGPYTPVQAELSQSFWITMRAYWPAELDALAPMPLVVISHGNGHDYTWYDWLGNHLASHGYVVISHRNDTEPGPVSAAVTTWQNTEAFLGALPIAEGGILQGEVDPHRIAWIGHSRGGEGVVIAYDDLVEGSISPDGFTADDIRLVSSIAPTVFEDPERSVNPHGVTYHLMAGSLDGDVTGGVDTPIVQYLRIFQNSTGLSAVTYVQGADHNDFNCCGPNDANWGQGGPGVEIGRQRAQQLAKSYYLALLEAMFRSPSDPGSLGDADPEKLWEYMVRAPEKFRPDETDVVVTSQLKRSTGKRVIDDFQTNPALELSSSGGAVTATVRGLAEGVFDDENSQLASDPNDPMNGMSQSHNDANPARGLVFEWDQSEDDRILEFELPADGRDLSAEGFVSFRACQGTRHPHTVALGGMASFSVALVDGSGNVSEIDHAVYGGLPSPYRRNGLGNGTGWVNEFQSVRIPIEAFAFEGRPIDLTDVVAIRFLFGASHGSPVGRIGLDDVEILAPSAPGAP